MEAIKLLLVDDEEDFVRTLSERLNLRNLESHAALSGEEALRLVTGSSIPDIMLLDLKMPGVDGMEVLKRTKKYYPSVQIIILTGHGNDLDEAEARRLGAFDYLKKPVDIEALVDCIRAAYHESKKGIDMSAVAFAEAGDFETARNMTL